MEQRTNWIDVARGIGLLCVFLGHLKTPYIATWVYTFHMPLFFLLSGILYKHIKWNDFINKKIKRLLIPYFTLGGGIFVVWSIIYLFQEKSPNEYYIMLKNFLIQEGFWPVWFLAALFVASIIQWIIISLTRDKKGLIITLSFLLSILVFVYYRLGGKVLPWCFDVACVAQFFMNIGYVFKNRILEIEKASKAKTIVLGMISLVLNFISAYLCIRLSGHSLDMSIGMYGNEFFTIISALLGIIFILCITPFISNRFILYLGKNTMILFAWHSRIIIVLCDFLYQSVGWFQNQTIYDSLGYTFATLLIILCILVPVTELVKRTMYRTYFGV